MKTMIAAPDPCACPEHNLYIVSGHPRNRCGRWVKQCGRCSRVWLCVYPDGYRPVDLAWQPEYKDFGIGDPFRLVK